MKVVNLDKQGVILLMVLFSFIVGVLILLFPYKIQTLAIRNMTMYNRSKYYDITSYVDWVKSRSYILFIRIMGFILICMGTFAFYILIKGI